MLQGSGSHNDTRPVEIGPRFMPVISAHPARTALLLGISGAAWLFLAWLATDMETPLAQLVMPMSPDWSAATLLAVWSMWSVMMVAMMLPSALPMILTFVQVAQRNGEPIRARAFVAAYVLAWLAFGAVATAAQWTLQRSDSLDAMAVRGSATVTVVLLIVAGLYQFSPLKRVCLASCRTPLAFLLGEWRPGVGGAFRMGLRHGLLCLGCCWALMTLLFVGGAMNVPWVAALAIAVAIEKLAPFGDRIAKVLGVALIGAGLIRWGLIGT